MNFVKNLVDDMKDEFTNIASEGKGAAEFSGYINTGCYMLNAVLSGSIYGGVPDNKILALAGEEATGKTFFALGIVKNFLEEDEENVVCFYDTEASITMDMMRQRGVDVNRVIIVEPTTIQQFRHHVLKLLKAYESKVDRPRMLIVLDSLGMLSTTKEMEDTSEGKETRDMTKAAVIKATFRVLTLKLAKAKVPLILTNHTYAAVGAFFPTKEMSGGSGLKYAASTIVYLAKKKERDGTEVVGNIIRATMHKSRLAKENAQVELLLKYESGLDPYYGLLPLAEKYGVIKKEGRQYVLNDGRKVFGKVINENPEEVYTPEMLDELDKAANMEYRYGSANVVEDTENE